MYLDLQSQLQRLLGLDERELMQPMRELIARSRTLVDVGANDGYYTLAFLGSHADLIVSCEPGPAWEQIVGNAKANGYLVGDRFQIIRDAIGNSEGCVPLAELVRGKAEPIFVKVDVDGSEHDVLQSAEGCLAGMDLSWIVEIHSNELEQACLDWLRQHEFKTRIIDHAWWRVFIPELRPRELNRWILATPGITGGHRPPLQ